MRESRTYGSVRGARRKTRPYRDQRHMWTARIGKRIFDAWNIFGRLLSYVRPVFAEVDPLALMKFDRHGPDHCGELFAHDG